jgi:chromosome partitioning protein
VQCEYLSLRGLVQLENTLSMIRENLNPNVEIIGILPTMFDRRTLHSREAIEILEENFGDLVFNTRIRKTIRYAEAPVKGSSVLKYDPSGSAADAYRMLAKEVQKNAAKARQHA